MKSEFQIGKDVIPGELERSGDCLTLRIAGKELSAEVLRWDPPGFTLRHCGHVLRGAFYRSGDLIDIHLPKGNFRIRLAGSRIAKSSHGVGGLSSPMPGKVVKIFVAAGDTVKKGDLLMMLEAMKMEHKILAPTDGRIQKIHFQEGERVGQDVELLELKP
jgi:Acetyl/propionyl-CoA carboxylase, alpha subunit